MNSFTALKNLSPFHFTSLHFTFFTYPIDPSLHFTLLFISTTHVPSLHFTLLFISTTHVPSLHFTSLCYSYPQLTSLHFTSLHFLSPFPPLTGFHFPNLRFENTERLLSKYFYCKPRTQNFVKIYLVVKKYINVLWVMCTDMGLTAPLTLRNVDWEIKTRTKWLSLLSDVERIRILIMELSVPTWHSVPTELHAVQDMLSSNH